MLANRDRAPRDRIEKGTQARPLLLANQECPHLSAEHAQQFLELQAHLLDDLLALAHVDACFFAGELVARAADGEALLVEQERIWRMMMTSWRW